MRFRRIGLDGARFEAVRFVGGCVPAEFAQGVADGTVQIEDDGRLSMFTSVLSLGDSSVYANPGDWNLSSLQGAFVVMHTDAFAARFEPVNDSVQPEVAP